MNGGFKKEFVSQELTLTPEAPKVNDVDILESVVAAVLSIALRHEMAQLDTISIPELLELKTYASPFQTIDWRMERKVLHTLQPLGMDNKMVAATRLRYNRTYLLCGMTRDMGQSICTLLVQQGARNIVLASRNPQNLSPQWTEDLATTFGATIRVDRVDVTDIASLQSLRQSLETNMPPVGGIVNGAMVLEDGVFACMTAKVFKRVMQPKTIGSQNLETVFWDRKDLDFFIMTSSFAAIGGHAGQCNYAAANMYMNCFAARRKMQGLAGSVMNIGVIHDLGFLHREKGELYSGLEREGYPPVSERDLHHMFLEAVVLGRPANTTSSEAAEFVDLTTGLSRFIPGPPQEATLHWHRDPRFSHHTTDAASLASSSMAVQTSQDTSLASLLECRGLKTDLAETVAKRLVTMFCRRLETLLHAPSDGRIRGGVNLSEVGVDSLVAVEMRSWLWQISEQDVPVMKILGAVSIEKLCLDIASNFAAAHGFGDGLS